MKPWESLGETAPQILEFFPAYPRATFGCSNTNHNIPPLKANEGKLLSRGNKIIWGHILDKFRYNTVDVSHVAAVQYAV